MQKLLNIGQNVSKEITGLLKATARWRWASIMLILVSISTFSCAKKTVTFWTTDGNVSSKHLMTIPGKCNCNFVLQYKQRWKTYTYADSSYIFISDGLILGKLPEAITEKYGKEVVAKFFQQDTMTLERVDKHACYWKLRKQNRIIIGYSHVPAANLAQFDEALNSLSCKRFNHPPSYSRLKNYKTTGISVKCKYEWIVL